MLDPRVTCVVCRGRGRGGERGFGQQNYISV